MQPPQVTFVWGLKRSGIHLVANWLYANHGGAAKEALTSVDVHPALADGFEDPATGVAFFNNCGRFHCRRFELGDLTPADFEQAARRHRVALFGIEDCSLRFAWRTAGLDRSASVLVLRDPLNNIASRLEAGRTRPELFRVDEEYVDLLDAYCREFLGHTAGLDGKTTISYDRFVADRSYRDEAAAALGLPNEDAISEVSSYGGGSSFGGATGASPTASLLTRFQQHPVPRHLVDLLLARPAVVEACETVFGYDLARRVVEV